MRQNQEVRVRGRARFLLVLFRTKMPDSPDFANVRFTTNQKDRLWRIYAKYHLQADGVDPTTAKFPSTKYARALTGRLNMNLGALTKTLSSEWTSFCSLLTHHVKHFPTSEEAKELVAVIVDDEVEYVQCVSGRGAASNYILGRVRFESRNSGAAAALAEEPGPASAHEDSTLPAKRSLIQEAEVKTAKKIKATEPKLTISDYSEDWREPITRTIVAASLKKDFQQVMVSRKDDEVEVWSQMLFVILRFNYLSACSGI